MPARDMLVDSAKLAAVLEESRAEGTLRRIALAGWTLGSLAVTIAAAIWWAATGH